MPWPPKKCKYCQSSQVILYGKRRRYCKLCHRTFSLLKNRTKKLRKASEQWILDRSTFARIQDKTGISKMGKWKQVQAYAGHIPEPLDRLQKRIVSASFILILDATFTRVSGQDRAIFIAYDTALGVIDYGIDTSEKKEIYDKILDRIQAMGYRPICVVSDGNGGLSRLLRENVMPHQRCITHLLRDLRELLGGRATRALKGLNGDIFRTIRNIWLTRTIEEIPEKINHFKRYSEAYLQDKELIVKWFWKTLPSAILHLSYQEKIPYTTNILENLNGQIKQRIKTMRGMKSQESLHNFLKIFFYFRNYK